MKTRTRLLCAVLMMVILWGSLCAVPFSASAAETMQYTEGDFEYVIKDDGTVEITGYNGYDSVVSIPSQIGDRIVTGIGDFAFYSVDIEKVTIPQTVITIGNFAFSYCVSLSEISGFDSVVYVGNCAFDSTAWQNNQPNGPIYIANCLYYYKGYCPQTLDIRGGTVSVSSGAFDQQGTLSRLSVPSTVQLIGAGAFSGCRALSVITVDENNSVYDSRDNCNAVIETASNTLVVGCKNTTIPGSVVRIGESAFAYCSYLNDITIPDSVKEIGDYAFDLCENLDAVVFPNSVTSIGRGAFTYCRSLQSVTIPDSVTQITDFAFYNCQSLKSITIPATVTEIGEKAFGYCWDDDIWDDTKVSGFTVYGYKDTAAEAYATDNGFTFSEIYTAKQGDADGDGEVTLMDVTQVQCYLSSMDTESTEEMLMFADIDKNGLLEVVDATWMQRYIADMEIPYEIG